ncbi:hypothetical protein [Rhodococcus opacus]|uniref:hypothetical protein n=1 Tax=Rhodococcus opacus TaxID=37919 RepID=UPI0002A2581C|nr:hypothetical protein [Rhodococcus opacus]ELB95172.1 hypothetical protein Rwratislav_00100 [Rhodococcus wratislaviensis IFP 2016]MBA8961619.1 3-carboxy-cis,cis-muconate cycloisomerase [Rhodococcus opacus]MBP2202517.1 3-carboxy-cis,cis-muconate cycloisomerase [Rhodococcus opacus]MDJ0417631.1 hypothetical protein [Rhodococcus opacus]MDX5967636.1 hypothetical protein [Rhodococcus opacus]
MRAATRARTTHRVLADTLREVAAEAGVAELMPAQLVTADDYLGEAKDIASSAVRGWHSCAAADEDLLSVPQLARS